MKRGDSTSFYSRFRNGQGGNIVLYVAGFMILWLIFFSVKDWIKSTKDARYEKVQKQEDTHYYANDIYHNPYSNR